MPVDMQTPAWADVREGLELIAATAERLGMAAYLVGGPVRDALTGRRVADVDVAVEELAAELARVIAQDLGGTVVEHDQFLTAEVRLPDGRHFDITTARTETYPEPGALPVVKRARIAEDLWRRDFTVNAMAVRLTEPGAGELLDPTGGREDLRAGILRGSHERSFLDDPTRIVRAAVYVERLGLKVESRTETWLREAIEGGALATVSGPRLGEQLARGIETAYACAILRRLEEWGALEGLHLPATLAYPEALDAVEDGQERLGMSEAEAARARFALAAGDKGAAAAVYLGLRSEYAQASMLFGAAKTIGHIAELERVERPVDADGWLAPHPRGALLAVWAAASPRGREVVEGWWQAARSLVMLVNGDDLLEAGIPRGPTIGVGLASARRAALDDKARTKEEQLQIALEAARAAL